MGEFVQHTKELLELKVSDFKPFVGFVEYMKKSPEVMTYDEMLFRDKRASLLANWSFASVSLVIFGLYKGAEYLFQ